MTSSDRRNLFKTMEGECKVLLDSTATTEAKPSSKLTTALLAFTLCLAAAAAAVLVVNRHTKVRTCLRLVSELLKGLDVSHSDPTHLNQATL